MHVRSDPAATASFFPESEATRWWQARARGVLTTGSGVKAGTGSRVAASGLEADGDEQGVAERGGL
jgi:hypothetical protein